MASSAVKEQVFVWQGLDRNGRGNKGEIESMNLAMAKVQLRRQGIRAKRVRKKTRPWFGGGGKITAADTAIFTRQLATMMKAGVPLVQSFDIVAEGLNNTGMQVVVRGIRNEVASGARLAVALRKYSRYFDDLYVNMVDAGESSGTLETMLQRIAGYQEKSEVLKTKIRKALTYPLAVTVVALVVATILLVKVVPQFAETFHSFGAELPAFTRFVLAISGFIQEWWLVILSVLIAAIVMFRKLLKRSRKFAEAMDRISLKTPLLGGILVNAVCARFSRTLATTCAAGVPLVEALEAVAGTAGNSVYAKAIQQIRADVSSGSPLYYSIQGTGLYPPMLAQMVSIGEESGSLDEMLGRAADHYEAAVDKAVDNLSELLEPVIMSILGILVGGLVVAMYLPIFMLGSVV